MSSQDAMPTSSSHRRPRPVQEHKTNIETYIARNDIDREESDFLRELEGRAVVELEDGRQCRLQLLAENQVSVI